MRSASARAHAWRVHCHVAAEKEQEKRKKQQLHRRTALFTLPSAPAPLVLPIPSGGTDAYADTEAAEEQSLQQVTDSKSGFYLSIPSNYRRKNKPGSSALWASPVSKYDQVGVSLEPVKINSLSQFGSIDDVSDRLMKSERQKSSTLDVRIDKQEAVTTASGTEKYLLLYELQNIYGKKQVATAATISNGRLYLLNAQSYLTGDSDADSRKASQLEAIAQSFDIIP